MEVGGDVGVFIIYFMQCFVLCKNGFVVIKNCFCKIVDMFIFKIGKYGYVKVYLVVFDIFIGKKFEDFFFFIYNMDVFVVRCQEYIFVSFVVLLCMESKISY